MSGLRQECGCAKRKGAAMDELTVTGMTASAVTDRQSHASACTSSATIVCEHPAPPNESQRSFSAPKRKNVRNAEPVDVKGRAVPLGPAISIGDRIRGRCCLFVIFLMLVWSNVCFFSLVPLYSAGAEHGVRDLELVRSACDGY